MIDGARRRPNICSWTDTSGPQLTGTGQTSGTGRERGGGAERGWVERRRLRQAGLSLSLSIYRASSGPVPSFGAVPGSTGDSMAEETRVIYHLEDQDTPYLIRINVPAQRVTLADFKQVLNKPNVKFFFKSVDDDFG